MLCALGVVVNDIPLVDEYHYHCPRISRLHRAAPVFDRSTQHVHKINQQTISTDDRS
jgi:hypothetical protein